MDKYQQYWSIRNNLSLSAEEKRQEWLKMSDVPVLAVDNFGHHYPVSLTPETYRGKHVMVLSVVATPGSWYVFTLLQDPQKIVALDYGQNWFWLNPLEVLDAVCNPGAE